MILVGTSGYSYEDWKGIFYPEDIKDGEMLEYYSKSFGFTEINSTYYKMPNQFMFKNLVKKVPDGFNFTVKAHGSFTHDRNTAREDALNFIEALKPLSDEGKLGCVLFQFPYSFHNTKENMDYLKKLREEFDGTETVYEFRNSRWACQEAMEFLKKNQIGWTSVDEPDIKGLVRPVTAVTSGIGYVRFHGRNSQKWYNHKQAYERYDYLYSEDELKEWIPRIKYIEKGSRVTFVAFNNHFRAQGAKNASMLKRLLEGVK